MELFEGALRDGAVFVARRELEENWITYSLTDGVGPEVSFTIQRDEITRDKAIQGASAVLGALAGLRARDVP